MEHKRLKYFKAKQFVFLPAILLMWAGAAAQPAAQNKPVHIIPEPVSVSVGKGYFLLMPTTLVIAEGKQASGPASLLARMLNTSTGYHLRKRSGAGKGKHAIILVINSRRDTLLGTEGYRLQASPQAVVIRANGPQGLFYGTQTLMQLLPPAIESKEPVQGISWKLPCVRILDYPRFSWRGLMLDVSRHFFPKEVVERYIGEMARYKFNVFHWHLSDDEGWRVRINGLPALTATGAWRVPRTGQWNSFPPPQPGEKATYGGYYTQQDIREVVAYAKKRFVTIVPEIDVPSHCLALIASYPGLSCTGLRYAVNPGSRFLRSDVDNVLCVANDSTWLVLDKIFTQIAALFPGKYIDVGGDEAHKSFWQQCPKDSALAKKEGFTIRGGLQAYFERKMEKLIASKGKKMIGWDEILNDGLPPDVAVMSWRGMAPGIKAAKEGHAVVMSPWGQAYLDLYQGDPLVEPHTYGMLRLKTCYDFEPLPDSVNPAYVLGGQGNLWTESVPNERQVQYMTWPRALALSEVFWSREHARNWPDFIRRVQWQFKYLDAAQVKYARSLYDPVLEAVRGRNDSLSVALSAQIPGLDLYYTFDGTDPDNFYPRYSGVPLDVPAGASQIRVVAYRGQRPAGRQINCPLSVLRKELEKKIKREAKQKAKGK